MNGTAKPMTVWTDQPRRTGFSWAWSNAWRLLREIRNWFLTRVVSFLGSISTPGMKAIGCLQCWALRGMGVQCASHEIWVGPHIAFDYPQNVVFGRRVAIGPDARITARDEVVIGDDFLAAPGLYLNTGTHDPETLVPQSSPISIGPGVWCGARVTVCAGVNIGGGSVIGAASLVLSDIPAGQIAYGVPARARRALNARSGNGRWSNFRRHLEATP